MIIKDFLTRTSVAPSEIRIVNSITGNTIFKGTVNEFYNSEFSGIDVCSWNWEQYEHTRDVLVCRARE